MRKGRPDFRDISAFLATREPKLSTSPLPCGRGRPTVGWPGEGDLGGQRHPDSSCPIGAYGTPPFG